MHKSLPLISILVWLGFSQTVFGQPTMDPAANRILKAHNAYMSSLSSLLVKADTTEETVYNETHKLEFAGMLSIGLRPPAQFFATVHETDKNRRMYLNNGTFTVFDEDVCTSSDHLGPFNPFSKRHFSADSFSSLAC